MTVQIESIGFGVDTSAVKAADKDLDRLGNTADKTSRKADDLTTSVGSLAKGFLGASAALAGLAKLTSTLDEYTKYTAILRNATGSQNEFNAALSDVRRIANTAQTDVAGLATTYARFSNALKEYGATQKQVATLTETVALGLKANGASAEETSSSMLQLSQAFGAGKLSGDEFRSMAEAAPNLMRALAASIGVPTGALKDMAAQGQITNEVLLKAFTDPKLSASLKSQADQITTFSGAMQKLSNEVSGFVATIGKNSGFADLITKAVNSLAIAVRELNQALTQGKVGFDSWLPAYEKFRAAMDKTSKTNFSFAPTINQAIGEGGFEGLKSGIKSISIMTDAEIEAAAKAQKEIQKQRDKALKESIENESKLRDAESAFRAKQESDYQDSLRKQWEAGEKEKAKLAKEIAEDEYKARQKYMDMLSKQAQDNFNEAQREAKKQSDEVEREYNRINENLSRGITDALMRGFDSGKSFVDNFIDTLKNAFKTLVLQPAIEFVLRGSGISGALASIGGLFSGNAGAANVSGTGGIGGGYDLVKGITRGFDGINSTFQSSIESLGVYLADSNYGLIKDLGGMIGQYSKEISNIAPYAGAALKLLSGDVKGALFTGAGTAIGSPFGPLGGAIGGAIGSAIGGLFGGKKETPKYSASVATTYANGMFGSKDLFGVAGFDKNLGGRDQLTALAKQYSETVSGIFDAFGLNSSIAAQINLFKRKGAWGNAKVTIDGVSTGTVGTSSTNTNPTYSQDVNESFSKLVSLMLTDGITKAIKASSLAEGIKSLFDGITDQTVMANLITATKNLANAQDELLSRYGLSLDMAGKIAKASGLADDALASFTNALALSALATQKTSVGMIKERDALKDLIGSLPSSVDAFDAVLKSINTTTADGQKQFADLFQLRDRFAQYTGTFDAAVKNVDSAIYGLLSPSEQLALDQSNLAKAFAELNISIPSSIQDLIDLGKSIDYSTESGLDLALAFPALVDMFNKTKESVNSLTSDLNAQYFSTRADFLSAQASNDPSMFIKQQAQTNSDLLAEIKQLKSDNANLQAVMITVAEYTFKQSRVLDDWDANGMPTVRTDTEEAF